MIRVFLLAENRLLREALVRMLNKKDDIQVTGAVGTSPEVIQHVMKAAPDVLLTDSALQIVSELSKVLPELKVVMIGMDEDKETFLRAVRDGAVGYVLKEASALDVVIAVRAAAGGEAICPPSLCLTLFKYVATQYMQVPNMHIRRDLALTRREQQLLELLGEGLTNKEIANRLNLSEQTVKNHVHRILRKLGASDRMTVVELYRLQGLVA